MGKGKDKAKKYQKSVQNKISSIEESSASLNDKLDNLIDKGKEDSKKANSLRNQINQNDENVSKLASINSELNDLGSSSTVYNILQSTAVGNIDIAGKFEYDPSSNQMNVYINNFDDIGLLGHELKHAYQFEKGMISFISGGAPGRLYDLQDEVEAYNRQMFLGYQGIGDYTFSTSWREKTGTSQVTPASIVKWNNVYSTITSVQQMTTSSLIEQIEPKLKGTYTGSLTYLEWQTQVRKNGDKQQYEVFK